MLHFVGYGFYTNNNNDDNKPINIIIENNNVILPITTHDIDMKNNIYSKYIQNIDVLKLLKIFYNICIFSSLFWEVIMSIIISCKKKKIIYFGGSLFQLVISVQYILGLEYFNCDHFYKKMRENVKINKYFKILLPLCYLVSLILTIIIITHINNDNPPPLTMTKYYSDNITVFLSILLFIGNFYGYSIFLINSITFSIIILSHKEEVKNYVKDISTRTKTSILIFDILPQVSIELTKVKKNFSESVSMLNKIFSSLTILGLWYLFFVLNLFSKNIYDIQSIINLTLFLVTEYIFINVAKYMRIATLEIGSQVNDYIKSINTLEYNNSDTIEELINEFSRQKLENNNTDQIKVNELLVESNYMSLIHTTNITERLIWNYLKETLTEDWQQFIIFGIELRDTAICEKITVGILAIFITKNLISLSSF
jgi:hypothetical protein